MLKNVSRRTLGGFLGGGVLSLTIPGCATQGMTDSEQVVIGLDSWIIEDGNYTDFRVSDVRPFAIEFRPQADFAIVEDAAARAPNSMRRLKDSIYAVDGRVLHVADDWWALDIGVGVFWDDRPPVTAKVGARVKGSVWLGIDPFFYFESLSKQVGAPALIYDWRIEAIEIETAPWILGAGSKRNYIRDPARLGWKSIPKTDARGGEWYLLHCKRLESPPRNTLK